MRLSFAAVFIILGSNLLFAQEAPFEYKCTVGANQRQALVFAPDKAKTEKSPLIFVFHGHGGSMQNTVKSFHLQTLWPDAIVVYPQGLKTPGLLTDPEGMRTGWQVRPGQRDDWDLKFFDTMLADLKKQYKVDDHKIFATGHSNGGLFTYLLWAQRGDHFAAMAPSAAIGFKDLPRMKPKPVLHIAGKQDNLVKFPWQQRMISALKQINTCTSEGKPWQSNPDVLVHESTTQTPVVTYIHSGGHNFDSKSPEVIVRFFQDQSK